MEVDEEGGPPPEAVCSSVSAMELAGGWGGTEQSS